MSECYPALVQLFQKNPGLAYAIVFAVVAVGLIIVVGVCRVAATTAIRVATSKDRINVSSVPLKVPLPPMSMHGDIESPLLEIPNERDIEGPDRWAL